MTQGQYTVHDPSGVFLGPRDSVYTRKGTTFLGSVPHTRVSALSFLPSPPMYTPLCKEVQRELCECATLLLTTEYSEKR